MPNIVKNTTFISLLDLIAPHSCRGCGHVGTVLCERCKKYILANHQNLCPICKAPNSNGQCLTCKELPPIFIIGERSNLLGDIIHAYKYQSIRALASPLAAMLDQILPIPDSNTTIVPLPTISRHIRARGFDHTYLVAKHLASLHSSSYKVQPILLRAKNTVQVGADRATRIAQASAAYTLNPRLPTDSQTTYLLLDDVWTTGASILTCLKKLQQAGAKNFKIALLSLSRID